MSFASDWVKLLLFEAKPGKQLNAQTWTAESGGAYYLDLAIGEIVSVEEDGSALTEASDMADCIATASSFYHDFFAGRLYVHLAAGDAPDSFTSPDYDHDVIAFVWKCFTNRQGENGETLAFVPDGCKYPHYYEPSLRSGSLSELSAAIADHFESAMQTTFGSISIANNEARWYAEVDDWLWGNKDARAFIGQFGDAYADLTRVFVGRVKSPVVSDEEVNFDFVDTREGRLQSIPPDHYSADDYANLDPDAEGLPIPILLGEKHNLTPVCIDTTAHTYKVTQTEFNGGADTFEQQSLDAVYLKGVALSLTTHYTVDLANGEFSLTFDPGDAEVTCDAKGIKNGFDFSSSPYGAATGVYSENVADHLFFVLHILNQIPVDEFNLESFAELQAVRTQAVAWYLNEDIATLDFNRMLQQTSLYHFLPLADGTFAARYYRRTVPEGALELRDYDHAGFRKARPNDGVFRDVFLRYDKDPTTGEWKQLVNLEASAQNEHGTKDPYVVDTALRAEAEAENILQFYVELLKNPPTKITTTTSMIARSTIPTDKVYVNRKVNADGREVTICADEVNVILAARKNIEAGTVELEMQLDTQLAIYTLHADVAHQDVAHEDHSDALHSDSDHGNSHTDTDHVDTPYEDESYSDHDDAEHDDHTDAISPPLHVDEPHEDHTDNTHTDVAHGNVAYADVPHVDTSHVDHSDTIHEDSHTDVAHVDSEV